MQMSKGMKIGAAKQYVAERLNIGVADLTDAAVMAEVREDLKLGGVYSGMGTLKGIEAKFHIARALDIEINALKRFRNRISS